MGTTTAGISLDHTQRLGTSRFCTLYFFLCFRAPNRCAILPVCVEFCDLGPQGVRVCVKLWYQLECRRRLCSGWTGINTTLSAKRRPSRARLPPSNVVAGRGIAWREAGFGREVINGARGTIGLLLWDEKYSESWCNVSKVGG